MGWRWAPTPASPSTAGTPGCASGDNIKPPSSTTMLGDFGTDRANRGSGKGDQERAGHAAACILGGFLSGHTRVSLSCLGVDFISLQDELSSLKILPASLSHQAEGAASNPSPLTAASPVHSSHIFEHLAAHHRELWKNIPFPKNSPGTGFWESHTETAQKQQNNRGLAQNMKRQRFSASKIKSLKIEGGKFKYSIKGKVFTSKRSIRQYLSRGMLSPGA